MSKQLNSSVADPMQHPMAPKSSFRDWLRHKKKFPHLWCPGCGLGIVLGAAIRSFEQLEYSKDDVVIVSGIGCTGRIPVYVDCNTLHTTHGRALTFATGIRLANPRLKVITFMGDGDALAIGGNHFIHACRRNIDITAIVVNNHIYGMTGGQASPTTPHEKKSTTTPYGQFAQPFDPCALATAAGATFVARATAANAIQMQKMFVQAMSHNGFSVVEVISNCPTCYGRLNRMGSAVDMLENFKKNTVRFKEDMDQEELICDGKFAVGVLHHVENAKEFIEQKNSVGPKEEK